METGIMILLWQYLYVKVTGEIKVTLNTTYDCVQFFKKDVVVFIYITYIENTIFECISKFGYNIWT